MSKVILQQPFSFPYDEAEWGKILWWEEVVESIGIYELETDRAAGIYIADKASYINIGSPSALKGIKKT